MDAGGGPEATLSEGGVVLSLPALLPGTRPDSDGGGGPARVRVPAGGSLKFPATLYSLSASELAQVPPHPPIPTPPSDPLALGYTPKRSACSVQRAACSAHALLSCPRAA